ncbi:MAG: Dabb family protein [Gammaproteobacteria bacterium]|nr:Dabb family protein [Gammaproteobacteria bacterium]
MIKHIVMWKLKEEAEGNDKDTNAKLMKEKLEAIANLVPGMLKLEVGFDLGLDATGYDVILYSEFENKAALAAYQEHPQHKAVFPFIGAVRESRVAVDYAV